jgi:hypothetical protein
VVSFTRGADQVKVGDLVRRKGTQDLAIVLKIDRLLDDDYVNDVYQFPEFMWLDTGEIDSCAFCLLEVIDESR